MILYTSYTDALGVSHRDEAVAQFENGKVYIATDGFLGTVGKGKLVAEYENGRIYTVSSFSGSRERLVGVYDNGKIHGVYNGIMGGVVKTVPVGWCSSGSIYSEKEGLVGKYSGDDEGAAAAAAVLLFRLSSNVFPYEGKQDLTSSEYARKETPQSSPGGCGCSGVGAFIGMFLLAAIGMLLYDYKEYMSLLFYVAIPIIILLVTIFRRIGVLGRNGFSFNKHCITSILTSLAISFVYVLVTVGVFMHKISGVQILNVDFAIGIVFIVNIITAIMLAQE